MISIFLGQKQLYLLQKSFIFCKGNHTKQVKSGLNGVKTVRSACFLLTIFLAVCQGTLFAVPDQATEVPWDTVVAEIKVVQSISEPDSIKSALLKTVFELREITLEDYQNFYREFMLKPHDEQRTFLEKIQKIIQTHHIEDELFEKS